MEIEAVNNLVTSWFAGEYTMFDACTDEPEIVWLAILEIVGRDLTVEQKSLLAAGPLETLLAWHGIDFIERIEIEAKKNAKFKYLLGGVWKQEMPSEIWDRILKARKNAW